MIKRKNFGAKNLKYFHGIIILKRELMKDYMKQKSKEEIDLFIKLLNL
jgi:hypothetical protein